MRALACFLAASLLGACKPDECTDNFAVTDAIGAQNAVNFYKHLTGRLPPPEEGLNALVRRPPDLPSSVQWTQLLREVPKDPWDRPYRIAFGDGYPGGFGIYTCGVDGVSDTQGNDPDDWNTWSGGGRRSKPALSDHMPQVIGIACGAALAGFLLGAVVSHRHKNRTSRAG
jgi:type II secretion system protein G